MKTVFLSAFAIAIATAPLSAATFDYDEATLSPSQKAQIFNVLNSDDNKNTKNRLIEAIVTGSSSSAEINTAAQVAFIEGSDENRATRDRLIEAVVN